MQAYEEQIKLLKAMHGEQEAAAAFKAAALAEAAIFERERRSYLILA